MVEYKRVRRILKLAVPVTVGLLSSFIMVFVDLAMLGSLGNSVLAAAGLASFAYAFVLSFVIGVAPAVQGIVARQLGEGNKQDICLPLHAGILIVLAIGIPLCVLFWWLSPGYFSLVSSDESLISAGVPYLQALSTAVIALGFAQCFQGHWAGMGKTKVYMFIVLLINAMNIVFNYMFIFGNWGAPELGAQGAGIATSSASWIGALLYFIVTYWRSHKQGFLQQMPDRGMLNRVFLIGLPESIREAMFALGYIIFYALVGLIGTSELAAMNVLIRVALLMAVFPLALGVAAATLTSEAVGRKDIPDADRWGWDTGKIGILWVTFLGLPLLLFPRAFLSLFLADPGTLEMAVIPLQMTGVFTGITSLIFIFAYALISLGDGNRVLLVSFVTQWLVFLPAVWVVGPYLGFGLLEVWWVQTIYALLTTALITWLWCDGKWQPKPADAGVATDSQDLDTKSTTYSSIKEPPQNGSNQQKTEETMNKWVEGIARYFLVLWFLICVVDGWGYLLFDVYFTGEPVTVFLSALMETLWFWWILKIVQTLAVLSLAINYKPALGLAFLLPSAVIMIGFYFFILTPFIPVAIMIIVAVAVLFKAYSGNYAGLLQPASFRTPS
ncbi:MAG: MATE family efflux transporter [Aestuariibacter sp.]